MVVGAAKLALAEGEGTLLACARGRTSPGIVRLNFGGRGGNPAAILLALFQDASIEESDLRCTLFSAIGTAHTAIKIAARARSLGMKSMVYGRK